MNHKRLTLLIAFTLLCTLALPGCFKKKVNPGLLPSVSSVAVISVTVNRIHEGDTEVYQQAADEGMTLLKDQLSGLESWTVTFPDAAAMGDVSKLAADCVAKGVRQRDNVFSGGLPVSYEVVNSETYDSEGNRVVKTTVSTSGGGNDASMLEAMRASGRYTDEQIAAAEALMGGDSGGSPSENCLAGLGQLAGKLGTDAVLIAHVATAAGETVNGVGIVENGRAVGTFWAQAGLALVNSRGVLAFEAGESDLQQFSPGDTMPLYGGEAVDNAQLDLTHGLIPARIAGVVGNALMGPINKLAAQLDKAESAE